MVERRKISRPSLPKKGENPLSDDLQERNNYIGMNPFEEETKSGSGSSATLLNGASNKKAPTSPTPSKQSTKSFLDVLYDEWIIKIRQQ